MPRIDDEVLDCAIYLFASEKDAERGTRAGGSGFLVGYPYEQNHIATLPPHHLYAVTNSHVVSGGSPVVRLNSQGGSKTIPLQASAWTHHPKGDDLAIAPIDVDRETYKFKYLSTHWVLDLFVTEERQEQLALGAGDEVFMVGRFMGREEGQRNVPVARFGHMAAACAEPIDQGEERGRFMQTSFLVEVHSISGFSGSPVFAWVPFERVNVPTEPHLRHEFLTRACTANMDPRVFFLGVDWGHINEDEKNFPGMTGVVPAWKLLELLSAKDVAGMRQEKEKSAKIRGRLD